MKQMSILLNSENVLMQRPAPVHRVSLLPIVLLENFAGGALNEKQETAKVTKEVVGIHALLTRSFFGGGIPRRLLVRVSLTKSTSVPVRF